VRYFFDTSALLKRYINEKGHAETEKLFDHADKIIVSSFTQLNAPVLLSDYGIQK